MRQVRSESQGPPTTPGQGQPAIVRDLLRSESWPGAARGPVELRTTHASWVFLRGADVFKLKRPVDLGFLDFRTVEARRRDCEDEVRLNRRLAPDVYLGILPVRRDAAGHHRVRDEGEGEGEVVDWAVHMRRLPDEASAASLLAAGRLGRARLAALARTVARSLDEAPRSPRFGEVPALRLNLEENLAQSRPFAAPDGMVETESLEAIWRHLDDLLRRRSELFVARVRAGRIREGHGDLRLEHVYFLPSAGDERPVVIDCVEFSERLRAGDVAAEIAFLAMELEAAGQPALAAGFLARSAEALDDFDLYGVLDFYLAYRAWVRAKVAGFVARDPQTDHAVRTRKLEEARLYFSLARASGARPVVAPAVVAVGGVIGSGKSTLAAALGAELAAPVISSDRTRKALAGLAATARGAVDLYTPERKDATYAEVLRRAEVILGSGRTVILDATFDSPVWRRRAADLARAGGARFAFLEASCPDWNIVRERVRERALRPAVSDAGEALVDHQIREGHAPRLADGDDHLLVDTRSSPAETVARALEALRRLDITPP